MGTSTITNEQLRQDLQFLLECNLETIEESVTRNSVGGFVEESLSILIISAYRPYGDHQFVLARYITPSGERGYGQLCYSLRSFMTMETKDSIEAVIENLSDQGRKRVTFFASGIKDGSLVDDDIHL
jgi:hypothetical protein